MHLNSKIELPFVPLALDVASCAISLRSSPLQAFLTLWYAGGRPRARSFTGQGSAAAFRELVPLLEPTLPSHSEFKVAPPLEYGQLVPMRRWGTMRTPENTRWTPNYPSTIRMFKVDPATGHTKTTAALAAKLEEMDRDKVVKTDPLRRATASALSRRLGTIRGPVLRMEAARYHKGMGPPVEAIHLPWVTRAKWAKQARASYEYLQRNGYLPKSFAPGIFGLEAGEILQPPLAGVNAFPRGTQLIPRPYNPNAVFGALDRLSDVGFGNYSDPLATNDYGGYGGYGGGYGYYGFQPRYYGQVLTPPVALRNLLGVAGNAVHPLVGSLAGALTDLAQSYSQPRRIQYSKGGHPVIGTPIPLGSNYETPAAAPAEDPLQVNRNSIHSALRSALDFVLDSPPVPPKRELGGG